MLWLIEANHSSKVEAVPAPITCKPVANRLHDPAEPVAGHGEH